MKIYVSRNDKNYIDEMKDKGYRDDIYVYTNGKFYKIFIYEKIRFVQDFEETVDSLGGFVPEPNTIFVKKVINEEIIKTLEMCNKEDYFEYLKPCELKENKLYKSLKIENLILIYSN